jgi:ATP-dependent DNA helicase RecQ
MLQVRSVGTESLRVALHRPWPRIQEICRHRRAVAQVVLAALLAKLPPGTKQAGYIVECKAKELLAAIESDIEIRGWLKDPAQALEHALLYLHENGVLQLDKGRAVFRAA